MPCTLDQPPTITQPQCTSKVRKFTFVQSIELQLSPALQTFICMCVLCKGLCDFIMCMYLCKHSQSQDTKVCHHHSTLSCHPFVATPSFSFTNSYPVAISNLFSISVILLFWICCVNGIIQYMTFEDGLLKIFWTFLLSISLEISLHVLHVSRVPFHC